jgi:hypothetical protein
MTYSVDRVMETQAFLVELVSNFEFSIAKDTHRVVRYGSVTMSPILEGEMEKGAQLPLGVSFARG